MAQSAATTSTTTRVTAMRRSHFACLAALPGPASSSASSTASTAGMSQGTRTAPSFGSQTRSPMLSAMKASNARAGGQRDSPMPNSTASSAGGAIDAWLGAVTARIVCTCGGPATSSPMLMLPAMAEATQSAPWFELVATVLLALATVATAWAAYQSRQWTGEQAQGYSHATATRIAANRTSAVANRQAQIDVATFIAWVDAHEQHNATLADFYRARFRDEFEPAFAAWLAMRPFENKQRPVRRPSPCRSTG